MAIVLRIKIFLKSWLPGEPSLCIDNLMFEDPSKLLPPLSLGLILLFPARIDGLRNQLKGSRAENAPLSSVLSVEHLDLSSPRSPARKHECRKRGDHKELDTIRSIKRYTWAVVCQLFSFCYD